jgi:hypothetical protein
MIFSENRRPLFRIMLYVGRMHKVPEVLAAFGIVIVLAGCGRVDAGATYFPEMIRERGPKPADPDPVPDVRALLQSHMEAVFVASTSPTNVSFSPAKPSFTEWQTCVRANVNGATGRAIGQQTFLVNITHGQVSRRERVSDNHWCATEHYEPL